MIIEHSVHPTFLSNSWLVAAHDGGSAIIIDSGAPIEPIIDAIELHSLTVTHLFNTHEHHDHTLYNVELQERYAIPLVLPDDMEHGEHLPAGDLEIVALQTPGHVEQHLSLLVNDTAVFTGDTLFAGSVGGTLGGGSSGFAQLRHSIMHVLMRLDPSITVCPGHAGTTTIGEELEHNPFIRVWRGLDPEGTEPVQASGHDATLVVMSPDYDGGTKAWVRFDHGGDAIVGGRTVTRTGVHS